MTPLTAFVADYAASWARLYRDHGTVARYQLRALRRLLGHASQRVPFYRDKLESVGRASRALDSLEDFQELPLTSKEELQQAGLKARLDRRVELSDCRVHETSGSTGEPMQIARTPKEEIRLFGRRLRVQIASGLRPWHHRVILGAPPTIVAPHRLGLFPVSGIELEDGVDGAISALEARRPDVLKGPPSFLDQLVERHPDRLGALRLQHVFTGAEQLSESLEKRLNEVCGCPVVNYYGAVECNLIAWRCVRCRRYHTCDDGVLVEVLRDGRPAEPGQEGEVVITALHSYAMPFIRYRLGDVVRLPKAGRGCGVGFGTIERIEGRVVDYLTFGTNEPVSPYTLMDQLDGVQGLARYEAEQTNPMSLTIRYQPQQPGPVEHISSSIRTRCLSVLPDGVDLRTEARTKIPLDAGRKRRFIKALSADHDRRNASVATRI